MTVGGAWTFQSLTRAHAAWTTSHPATIDTHATRWDLQQRIRESALSPVLKPTLLVLAAQSEDGVITIPTSRVAWELGKSRDLARRRVEQLVAVGVLERVQPTRGGGTAVQPSVFRVKPEALPTRAPWGSVTAIRAAS